jgi:hypothetical protein
MRGGSHLVIAFASLSLAACLIGDVIAHPFQVDQASEGLPFGGFGISAESGDTIGQEFTPTFSALDVVEIGLGPRDPNSFGLKVNIRADSLAGPILGTSLQAAVQGAPPALPVFHFDFASPVPLVPGNVYVIQPILVQPTAPVGFSFLDPPPYAGGRAIIHGVIRDDIDMIFRTGLTVPEPATISMCSLVVALLLRRRRAAGPHCVENGRQTPASTGTASAALDWEATP